MDVALCCRVTIGCDPRWESVTLVPAAGRVGAHNPAGEVVQYYAVLPRGGGGRGRVFH